MEGGGEKNVEAHFIESKCFVATGDLATDRKLIGGRDTLGRCRRKDCTSFIRDCGHAQPNDMVVDKILAVQEKRKQQPSDKNAKKQVMALSKAKTCSLQTLVPSARAESLVKKRRTSVWTALQRERITLFQR